MMNKSILLVILVSAQIFLPVWATEVEDRLNRAMSSLDNLQADFKQTLLDDNKKIIQQSMGKVSIQRPGKFLWIYEKPYEQQIIADGKELWVYDVDLDQATVKPMEASLSSAPIMVLMKKQRVETEFEVNEIGMHKILYWIELIPKSSDMEYSKIYIGMDGEIIKAMELRDSFGQSTQITFENQRLNMIFKPNTFKFNPPPGVDVFGVGG
ncbi:MAG: outer membrane lipoprotein chaperone LolA [Gammaproteobacteria bacterium]|jgi:outer membrane lipoprotein carrier protein|nr:outer membrane lipoprotein chaperone LolA [Gammaproteobacteria bacterium]MBT4076441.1 outer membrane lipoprotein chaperone LolA [Gammaproteobacteria bacterium]MBT4193297.1 outer membrane lipoprotein chaperone LolA [Gammaproteobacteria bacterium]MBT4449243.1 outer membrane lipoprotein chaperone LolA [Gammaproteobacteria bacterium]MBT4862142.1 outer membrane lipoprotein chaperone LolA [Gammaproteobacteria bacterium]